jgi:hypothetical protein
LCLGGRRGMRRGGRRGSGVVGLVGGLDKD